MSEVFNLAFMPGAAFGQEIDLFKIGGLKGLQSESYVTAMYRIERPGVYTDAGWFLHSPIILVTVVKFAFTIAGMALGFQFGYGLRYKLAQVPAASALVLMLVFFFINRRYRGGRFPRGRCPGGAYRLPSAASGGAVAALFHVYYRPAFLCHGFRLGAGFDRPFYDRCFRLRDGVKVRPYGIGVGWR